MMTQRTFRIEPFGVARRAFDDLLETVFDTMIDSSQRAAGPRGPQPHGHSEMLVPVNIWESDESLFVECELPGFEMGDIDITLVKNQLTLNGRRQINVPEKATLRLRERLGDRFSRTIELPVPIVADRAEARLVHGVLQITLPKQQAARARKIEICSA